MHTMIQSVMSRRGGQELSNIQTKSRKAHLELLSYISHDTRGVEDTQQSKVKEFGSSLRDGEKMRAMSTQMQYQPLSTKNSQSKRINFYKTKNEMTESVK